MRKLCLVICLVLYLVVESCTDSGTTSQASLSKTEETSDDNTMYENSTNEKSTQEKEYIIVEDNDGQKIDLEVNENTLYCAMASWCPSSRKILEIFNSEKYRDVTGKYNIVFLYDKDEIGHIQRNINKDPEAYGFTNSDLKRINEKVEELKGISKLFFPEVLSEQPSNATTFYYDENNFNYDIKNFPSSYISSDKGFTTNPLIWIYARGQNTEDTVLIKEMVDQYNKSE